MEQYIEKYEKDIRDTYKNVGEQNQYVCARMLYHFDKFCRENDLKYTIECGTLLGAYREKNFIPWDLDIDISMEVHDFKKLWSMDLKNKIPGYFFQNTMTDPFYNSDFTFGRLVDLNSSVYPTSNLRLSPNGAHIDIQCVGKREDIKEIINKDTFIYHFKKDIKALGLSLVHLLSTGELKRVIYQMGYFSLISSFEVLHGKKKYLAGGDDFFNNLHIDELEDIQIGDIKVMCIKKEYAIKRIIERYGENYLTPPPLDEIERDTNRLRPNEKFKTSAKLRKYYF